MVYIASRALCVATMVALVACGRSEPDNTAAVAAELLEPAETEQPKASHDHLDVSALPRRFLVDTELLQADIRIPDEVFIVAPKLAAQLVDEAEAALETAKQTAEAHRSVDTKSFQPHVLRMSWQVTGAAGPLISLEQFVYDFSGAVHPSFATHGIIFNLETGTGASLQDLLIDAESGVNAHLDAILEAVVAQKMEAGVSAGAEEMVRGELTDLISAEMILASAVSLVDSTTPGKFGGYAVHFAPYEIGAFAEGAYHVTVPQSEFKAHVRAEYSELFDGVPIDIERPDAK